MTDETDEEDFDSGIEKSVQAGIQFLADHPSLCPSFNLRWGWNGAQPENPDAHALTATLNGAYNGHSGPSFGAALRQTACAAMDTLNRDVVHINTSESGKNDCLIIGPAKPG